MGNIPAKKKIYDYPIFDELFCLKGTKWLSNNHMEMNVHYFCLKTDEDSKDYRLHIIPTKNGVYVYQGWGGNRTNPIVMEKTYDEMGLSCLKIKPTIQLFNNDLMHRINDYPRTLIKETINFLRLYSNNIKVNYETYFFKYTINNDITYADENDWSTSMDFPIITIDNDDVDKLLRPLFLIFYSNIGDSYWKKEIIIRIHKQRALDAFMMLLLMNFPKELSKIVCYLILKN
jgi:hypothetical protein